ncbi:MAG: NADH:flavin oxidoreductase, partial [Desulfuromonadaceae bacterium]|nr:NADH:flavin oxidoreductase [Desulfuromonadaceae bacterium]
RTTARVVEITADCVRIVSEGSIEEIPAESVVLAVGTRSNNSLHKVIAASGIPFRVVGDAFQPAMVLDAIHQGFTAGCEIG